MLRAAVFGVAFLLLFGITVGVYPALPPGQILVNIIANLWTIPENTHSILGYPISSEFLVRGIMNGIFWGAVFAVIFDLGRRYAKKEVIMLSIPTSAPSSPSTPPPVVRPPPRIRKMYSAPLQVVPNLEKLNRDVEAIEGIGPTYGRRLRLANVRGVGDLLRRGSTRKGRRDLADTIGVNYSTIYKWISRADFFRIRGVGKQYSDLLESSGVNTVVDLSRRDSEHLYEQLQITNRRLHLVRRAPTHSMVARWIQHAKTLEPIVEY